MVKERIASLAPRDEEEDYFTDPEKRLVLFERDNWICQYCGETVSRDNATLDHYIPQRKGGGESSHGMSRMQWYQIRQVL